MPAESPQEPQHRRMSEPLPSGLEALVRIYFLREPDEAPEPGGMMMLKVTDELSEQLRAYMN